MARERILVFQTAFIGDVILTTPMIQVLCRERKNIEVDVVAVPAGASILANHPDVHSVHMYDKKGKDRGLMAALSLIRTLRRGGYDVAIIPHRSLRSVLICLLAGIPRRIGFSTSAAKMFMTDVVEYRPDRHEVERNMSLLTPLQIPFEINLPQLYPSPADYEAVDKLLHKHSTTASLNMIALAPGSEWVTKRWLAEGFIDLAKQLLDEHFSVVLIGGRSDLVLCREIESAAGNSRLINAAGELSLLQSAELIR
ncbi:MAG: glycosyltransferase family 9 protein, partial [bacterium]